MGRGKPAPTLLHFIFKDHQPTGRSENIPPSRQRRLNSIVADATGQNHAHRGLKPIGIYTISGFPESHHRQVVDRSIPTYKTLKNPLQPHHRQVVDRSIPTYETLKNPLESHHRQVVDRSIPTYKTLKNPLESHHRQVVDRSIPTFVFRCRARRLDLNDPPPAGGGILGNLPSPCRLGLNDPPAPAGGIRLNIICLDTNGLKPTANFRRRCGGGKTRAKVVAYSSKTICMSHDWPSRFNTHHPGDFQVQERPQNSHIVLQPSIY